MTSVNRYVGRELQRIRQDIELRSADERKQQRHRKNIDEFLNFTSNLISLLGNTGVTFQRNKKNDSPTLKFRSSIKDYKGAIAGDMFSARFRNAMGKGLKI